MSNPTEPEPQGAPIDENRRAQIYPRLDGRALALLASYGDRRRYAAGEILFAEGQRHAPMFVLLSGSVDVVRRSAGGEILLIRHHAGDFTGEVALLTGNAAIVTARACEDTEVIVIEEMALRRLIVAEAGLSELIMRAFILRRVSLIGGLSGGATIVGSRHSGHTLRLRQFLTSNAHPHTYLDVDRDPDTAALLERFGIGIDELPVVIAADGRVMRTPSNREVADSLGLGPERLDGRHFDVVVIGAGPAGLAAAVYAASEGLDVVVLDTKAPGGQAGTSSRIENYFGFPTGISGRALAARGFLQAEKFGAEVAIPREVVHLDCKQPQTTVEIDGPERITARAVIIASGARYRKPALANLEVFEGRGIYYGASFMEAQLCTNQEVIVVGGGNSAGQAAVFLSTHTRHVHILVRASGLAASMSDYLIQQIHAAPNITLRTETEIVELLGSEELEGVRWQHGPTRTIEEHPIQHVFLFLGADPNTSGMGGCLVLDTAGFVKTGSSLTQEDLRSAGWPRARPPHPLETSRPGVFAVGDVRSGSVKRVAAAVGEGSTAVQMIHAVLAETAK